jgi:O-antigen/teichoic acid export membrane protein
VNSFFDGIILLLADYLAVLQKATLYVIATLCKLLMNIGFSVFLITHSTQSAAVSRITGGFYSTFIVGIVIIGYFCANKEKIIEFKYVKFGLVLTVPLIFHALSGIILTSSDKIMLSRIRNDSITGLYSFAASIVSVLNTISYSFNTAWRPYTYEALNFESGLELRKRTEDYLSCYTILTCGFMLVMPEVIKLLAAREYWECIPIVIPLALSELFHFLYYIPVNYEFYKKYNKLIPVASTVTGICNICFNLLLIPRYGAMGAAFATLLSEIIGLMMHDLVARFLIGDFYIGIKEYAKYSISALVIAVMVFVALEIWIIRWFIAVVLGSILLKRLITKKQLF